MIAHGVIFNQAHTITKNSWSGECKFIKKEKKTELSRGFQGTCTFDF